MFASEGEILTLRPVGFTPDRAAIESYLRNLPGSYQRSNDAPWTLVAPAAGKERLISEPMSRVRQPNEPHYATVAFLDDGIWIHPGLIPDTWARAQNVVIWLLGLGSWRITGYVPGQEREFGVIHFPGELFNHLYYDPDIPRLDPKNPTESPPRVGVLTTFRRYLGDPDSGDYFHEILRVHDSGAFSFWQYTAKDSWRWEGRLEPEMAARWSSFVAQLDFDEPSPGHEAAFEDRVAIIVERPGEELEKVLDAAHPPKSFASLVRLMDGWGQSLSKEEPVPELANIRVIE